jgi:predicted Zn-dependent protease
MIQKRVSPHFLLPLGAGNNCTYKQLSAFYRNETPEALLRRLGTGILVTRLWYIREVDPFRKIMTGMTRDGTFLVEDGQIVAGLHNFRFNESVIDVLNRVEAMSPTERASGEEAFDMAVPAMLVDGFTFSEVTLF